MKNSLRIFLTYLFLLIVCPVFLHSQDFQKGIFIDIPGNNFDFDISESASYPGVQTYITWINKIDSNYTVYLKKISPEIGDNVIVISDTQIKSNTKIAFDDEGHAIKIAWQSYSKGAYQVYERDFINDNFNDAILIRGLISSDPQMSLSANRIVWIEDGSLYLMNFYPIISSPIIIDSSGVLSPDIQKDDDQSYTRVLYVKINNYGSHTIKMAEYDGSNWNFEVFAVGNNKNPKFGVGDFGMSFEKMENQVSKITYTSYIYAVFMTTANENCNYRNSQVLSYDIPIGSDETNVPFFVSFDTDSMEDNSEVLIKTFYFGSYDSLINVSNMEGNDYKPKIAFVSINDTVYAAIFWLHESNSKIDIWFAKAKFIPIFSSVENDNFYVNTFQLKQNYPNPFNPSTKIEYQIPKSEFVSIKVYDLLGREIATLVNEKESAGNYEVEFDASDLSSGVYLYQMVAGNFSSTKKFIYMK
ncbi:T9SS type A sorting domain-containing protein [bacterium BMS3Abin03]|nr:T9SS type A sorting domain-containing protein [bacterium BMS3Abin03]